MGQIILLLNGGGKDDNRRLFTEVCEAVRDKIGRALDENETILFQARPLGAEYDPAYDRAAADRILRRETEGLFRHLKMASSFDIPEIGDVEKFRIKIDIFFLDHFINIKLFDIIFDTLQESAPNTFELLCIYQPYEKERKYQGFVPEQEDLFYILQADSAGNPVTVYRGDAV